jgi:hypothetical protein
MRLEADKLIESMRQASEAPFALAFPVTIAVCLSILTALEFNPLNCITRLSVNLRSIGLFLRVFLLRSLALLQNIDINPLTPELNPSAQRCLTRFLLGILLLEPCIWLT